MFFFFQFLIEIEGQCGWIIGGGGQRVCWPPSHIIGGLAPLFKPTPTHFTRQSFLKQCIIQSFPGHRRTPVAQLTGRGFEFRWRGNSFNRKRDYVAHNLSSSPSHCPDMTEMPLEKAYNCNLSIHTAYTCRLIHRPF